MAGAFSEEDRHFFKTMFICTDVVQKYMHVVYRWGTFSRYSHENLIEYLDRRNDPNKTSERLMNIVKSSQQKKLLFSDKSGSTFDVSLLYLCIRYGCDNLASSDDRKWWTPGRSLESLVHSIKESRNELFHTKKELREMNGKEFFRRTEKTEQVLEDMLRAGGQKYNKDESIINRYVASMRAKINRIRMRSFVPQNCREYKMLTLFFQLRDHTCLRAKELLTNRYNDIEIYVSPITDWPKFKFNARHIYTDMIAKDVGNKSDDIIEYEDILKDHKKDRTYPVILVEAISGMGKTVLMKRIISDWLSRLCVMKNLDCIDLLLYVECRDSSIDTFQKLLQHLMPKLSQDFMGDDDWKVIKDLNILVLIDGLDELNSASEKLLKNLLVLKRDFGITLLATSRPDSVPSFNRLVDPFGITIKHICLDKIRPTERNNFVDRYHSEMITNDIKCQDDEDLKQTLQNKQNHLDEFLENPYNLALTCILWNYDPPKINVSTTPPELYYHIHQLSKEKLLGRLQRHTCCQNLSSHILEGKIPHFTYALCKESFICLKNDELILDKEAVDRLTNCCTHNDLPYNEMLSSFLQEKGPSSKLPNERRMKITHKGARAFLASLYIWFELERKTSTNIDEYLKTIMETSIKCEDTPATTDEIKTAFHNAFRELNSRANVEERNVIRDLLLDGENIHPLSEYKNLLINLLGVIYQKNGNGMESTKKDIFNLLEESGIKSRNQWFDVLEGVNDCDEHVLKWIAGVPGVMEESVEITNSNLILYTKLIKHRQPKSINLKVTGDLCRNPCMEKLFPLIKEHGIKVISVEIDNHNAQVLSKKLDLKDSVLVDVSSKTDGSLLDVNEFIQKINRNGNGPKIRNLCLHYHYRNPTSPVQFESVLNHLSKHYQGKEYVGPITESTTLPTTLRNISASVADLKSYNNMCDKILKMKELEELSVCLPLSLSHESLKSIDVCPRKLTSFICHIPDVQDTSVEDVVRMIKKVTRDIRCVKLMICFPRANIDGDQVEKLLLRLASTTESLRLSVIFLPESCCSADDKKGHLQGIAGNRLSCKLRWEGDEEELWNSRTLLKFAGDLTSRTNHRTGPKLIFQRAPIFITP